jgi:uncharacterized surface protein with fasciclin (FAS1) repeats
MKSFVLLLVLTVALAGCGESTSGTSDPGTLGQMFSQAPDNDPGVGTFASALKTEELKDVLDVLSQDEPYTAFVPNNAAFEEYFVESGITKEEFLASDELATVIRAHIAPGKYTASDFTDGASFENLNGELLTVTTEDDTTYINEAMIDGEPGEEEKGEKDALYFLLDVITP